MTGDSRRRARIGTASAPDIAVTAIGRDRVAALRGEIDLAAVAKMSPIVNDLMRSAPPRLVLELTGVSFIDSRGLAMIVGLLRRIEAADGRLVVVCPPGAAREAIELAGVGRLLTFAGSVDAALGDG